MIMSTEPRWLIGGPAPTPAPTLQQAEPAPGPHSIIHARNPFTGRATCERTGWMDSDLDKVDCPACLEIVTGGAGDTPQDVPEATGRYKGKTAAQHRELAERAARSTDPAVRLSAKGDLLCAQLAEVNGIWEFPALFTLTGALVPQSTYVRTKKGPWVWRIGTGEPCQWFAPSKALSGARRRANDAAKGYALGTIRARGYVGFTERGNGIGYYIGQVASSPVEIVDDGKLGTRYQDR